jgi:dephospho-CoA kinase
MPFAFRPGRFDQAVFFLGLTGSPGSGKSEVLKWLRSKGSAVLSADRLGHGLLRRPALRKRLVRRFGKTILGARGNILRKRLAFAAFRTPGDTRYLNRVMHPAIRREVESWMRDVKRGNNLSRIPLAAVEAALLHEDGWAPLFDGVLCISAPFRTRKVRLEKRGWEKPEILNRERMQWTARRKSDKSDWVLDNGGTQRELRARLERWLKNMKFQRN